MADTSNGDGFTGRVRRASIILANANPQLGMWQAAGTAIAQAPNIQELRGSETGGNIEFNAQGHSALSAVRTADGGLTLVRTATALDGQPMVSPDAPEKAPGHLQRRGTLAELNVDESKHGWNQVVVNGLKALYQFVLTPSGFLITIYFLNIVAWGAMLFFLLLKAAPAMNYPTADDDNSPRKIWLEIDSQILNALFCVTGFGLAFWRFRDLYYLIRVIASHDAFSMRKLAAQNKGWFRPPAWFRDGEGSNHSGEPKDKSSATFTGDVAPPTALWKLGFNICMMVLNTLFQVVLSYFMWGYNRLNRPTWATGAFIGLGCGVAMFAGLMSWWEGRKVKMIEGPEVKIVEKV